MLSTYKQCSVQEEVLNKRSPLFFANIFSVSHNANCWSEVSYFTVACVKKLIQDDTQVWFFWHCPEFMSERGFSSFSSVKECFDLSNSPPTFTNLQPFQPALVERNHILKMICESAYSDFSLSIWLTVGVFFLKYIYIFLCYLLFY